MSNYYVYGFFEPNSEVPFYIGKGKGDRILKHFKIYNNSKTTLLYRKLNNLLRNKIITKIRILFRDLTETRAFELEIAIIKLYGRIDNQTGCLCNHTNGGEGMSGRIFSDETKRKISEHHIGNTYGLGYKHTFEAKLKISQTSKKPKSLKALANLRKAAIKRGIKICSYSLNTGEIIKIYESINSVNKDDFNPRCVTKVINGERPHHRFYGWRYL